MPHPSDDELLASGAREWEFEKRRNADNRFPDGRPFDVRVEEPASFGGADVTDRVLDSLTFRSDHAMSRRAPFVVHITCEGDTLAAIPSASRDDAVQLGAQLIAALRKNGPEALPSGPAT